MASGALPPSYTFILRFPYIRGIFKGGSRGYMIGIYIYTYIYMCVYINIYIYGLRFPLWFWWSNYSIVGSILGSRHFREMTILVIILNTQG